MVRELGNRRQADPSWYLGSLCLICVGPQAAQIYITKIDGVDLSRPIEDAAALFQDKTKSFPLLQGDAAAVPILHWIQHKQAGLPIPEKIGLRCLIALPVLSLVICCE